MDQEQKTKNSGSLGMVRGALLLSAVLFIGLAAIGGPALAAKGGQGHGRGGNGGGTTTTATCAVTPNPLTGWEVGTLSGSGFPAYASLGITIRSETGNISMGFATAGDDGRFSKPIQGWPGTNTVTVSGGGATATCTFQVV